MRFDAFIGGMRLTEVMMWRGLCFKVSCYGLLPRPTDGSHPGKVTI